MAYAGLSDVQGLVAQLTLDASSRPTATQVGVIITQVSAEIDAVISAQGYVVPVVTPAWFLDALKLLNAYGAAAIVLRSMKPQRTGGTEDSASPEAQYLGAYQRGLKRLETGEGIPGDLPLSGSAGAGVTASTYFTRNPNEEEDCGDIAEPFFPKAKVF